MQPGYAFTRLMEIMNEKMVKEVDLLITYANIINIAKKKGIAKRITDITMIHMVSTAKRLKPVYNIVIERYPETKPLLDAIYEGQK